MGTALASYISIQTVKNLVNAFMDAETATVALQSALKDTGAQSEEYYNQLTDLASQLQKTSAYEDDEIKRLQALLLSYGNTTQQVKQLTPFLVDLASKMSLNSGETVSLKQAYTAYTSAINGMEKPLRQYGINLDDAIVKSKNATQITEQLQKATRNASKEFADTTKGSLTQMNNELGNVKEALGQILVQFNSEGLKNASFLFRQIGISVQFLADQIKIVNDSKLKKILDIFNIFKIMSGENLISSIRVMSGQSDPTRGAANAFTGSLNNLKTGTDSLNTSTEQLVTTMRVLHSELVKQATVADEIASKQQIIADTEANLGINMQSTSQQIGTAAQVMYDSLLPLSQMADITSNNLSMVFSGEYKMSESLRNAGNQILQMLTQMIIKSILLNTIFKAIGLISGSIFGGAGLGGAASAAPTIGAGGVLSSLSALSPVQPSLNALSAQGGMTVINYSAPFPVASNREIAKDVIKIIDNQQKLNSRYTK